MKYKYQFSPLPLPLTLLLFYEINFHLNLLNFINSYHKIWNTMVWLSNTNRCPTTTSNKTHPHVRSHKHFQTPFLYSSAPCVLPTKPWPNRLHHVRGRLQTPMTMATYRRCAPLTSTNVTLLFIPSFASIILWPHVRLWWCP